MSIANEPYPNIRFYHRPQIGEVIYSADDWEISVREIKYDHCNCLAIFSKGDLRDYSAIMYSIPAPKQETNPSADYGTIAIQLHAENIITPYPETEAFKHKKLHWNLNSLIALSLAMKIAISTIAKTGKGQEQT